MILNVQNAGIVSDAIKSSLGGRVIEWQKYEIALKGFVKENLSISQILEKLGANYNFYPSRDALTGKLTRLRSQSVISKIPEEPIAIEDEIILRHLDNKPADQTAWEELLTAFTKASELFARFDISQYSARSVIKTKRPIALCFSSDWHIGNPFVNYTNLTRDLNIILNNRQIFMGLGGDLEDKFIPGFYNAEPVANQVVPPQIQMMTVKKIISKFGHKIFAKIGGNHDVRDERATGIRGSDFILTGKTFPYLRDGGLVKLTVGDMEYNIIWKHKWRYNSSLNRFNSHHRMREILYELADIVVQEHIHDPGIEQQNISEFDLKRQVVNIRTGSYLAGDRFSREFFKEGVAGPQTVILFPDRKKIVPFDGPDALLDAEIYLGGIENAKAKKPKSD